MANQPIIEKIKVEYTYLENGKTIRGAKRLVELTDKEKSSIVSLAVLPIKNVDGTNNKQNVDISKHIQGFPILSSLFLPIHRKYKMDFLLKDLKVLSFFYLQADFVFLL